MSTDYIKTLQNNMSEIWENIHIKNVLLINKLKKEKTKD